MGDSVPKHAGPISLTDTHPRTEHLPNATDHQRRESQGGKPSSPLEQADLLPKDLRASIDKQILAVAATVK